MVQIWWLFLPKCGPKPRIMIFSSIIYHYLLSCKLLAILIRLLIYFTSNLPIILNWQLLVPLRKYNFVAKLGLFKSYQSRETPATRACLFCQKFQNKIHINALLFMSWLNYFRSFLSLKETFQIINELKSIPGPTLNANRNKHAI